MSRGISDLSALLAGLEPMLVDGEFVYATVSPDMLADCLAMQPIGLFHEAEGLTLILPREAADAVNLEASAPLRCITITVHSSLEAVGMTAALATALTREGISANVVAAYYHDHIFVPVADAHRAIEAIRALSVSAT
ncbi:ACT domain-containing protein [Rhizobium sp. SL42]|uniref:ACT domain-containing protein n=1 Tax=Rhizobium sp. SL42 TaxID=2806346 RepID=UPI001F2EFDE6|nr:ACT domain-containing protein [Rhizobium sp. SL42]UJW75042.1 ACT domain-containing protein [Rhizobium sp. SL42]